MPDRVLIGGKDTETGRAAIASLARWVPAAHDVRRNVQVALPL